MRRATSRLAALFVLAALCGSCYTVRNTEVPVWTETIQKTRYLQVNLRGDNVFLDSANDLDQPIAVRLGAPAVIEHYGAKRVDLRVRHLKYTMYPRDGQFDTSPAGVQIFLDKYLTESPSKLDASSVLGSRIAGSSVAVGMTKEQVYRSLGPPRWIEQYIPTLHLSKDRILASKRWVYTRKVFAQLIPQEQAYVFHNGKLVQAIPGS